MKTLFIGAVSALGGVVAFVLILRSMLNRARASGQAEVLAQVAEQMGVINESLRKEIDRLHVEYENIKHTIPNDWDSVDRMREAGKITLPVSNGSAL